MYCERNAQHVRLKKEDEEDAMDGEEHRVLVVDERGSVVVRLVSRVSWGRRTLFILLVKVFGVVVVVVTVLIGASWVEKGSSSTFGV